MNHQNCTSNLNLAIIVCTNSQQTRKYRIKKINYNFAANSFGLISPRTFQTALIKIL